jgi:hypothetical protein
MGKGKVVMVVEEVLVVLVVAAVVVLMGESKLISAAPPQECLAVWACDTNTARARRHERRAMPDEKEEAVRSKFRRTLAGSGRSRMRNVVVDF